MGERGGRAPGARRRMSGDRREALEKGSRPTGSALARQCAGRLARSTGATSPAGARPATGVRRRVRAARRGCSWAVTYCTGTSRRSDDVSDEMIARLALDRRSRDQRPYLVQARGPPLPASPSCCIGKYPPDLELERGDRRVASGRAGPPPPPAPAGPRDRALPASRPRAAPPRAPRPRAPRGASPPAPSGRRRGPARPAARRARSSSSCSSVSAVPMIATVSGIPAWCRASTSV